MDADTAALIYEILDQMPEEDKPMFQKTIDHYKELANAPDLHSGTDES